MDLSDYRGPGSTSADEDDSPRSPDVNIDGTLEGSEEGSHEEVESPETRNRSWLDLIFVLLCIVAVGVIVWMYLSASSLPL